MSNECNICCYFLPVLVYAKKFKQTVKCDQINKCVCIFLLKQQFKIQVFNYIPLKHKWYHCVLNYSMLIKLPLKLFDNETRT